MDLALGGGWAERRIANIVGDKSTGKTLLAIEATANFALKYPKGRIRYCEAEAAFDVDYARALGMPVDRVDFTEPMDTVEQLFEDLSAVVKDAKHPTLYVVDSLDALSDESEMSRDIDKGSYGAEKAKKMSQLFRRLARQMAKANLTLIIISQTRDKIGVMFGDRHSRAGGKALDFYASQVPWLANVGRITKTIGGIKRVVGVDIRAKIKKNKVGLPFREADFTIRFGYGIDDISSCLDWLAKTKTLKHLGLSDKELDLIERKVLEGPDEETQRKMDEIRALVEKKWQEIETSFLPQRPKYGA